MELGKYNVIAELGRGGMGEVFLAIASGPGGFNKLIVLKALRAEVSEDSEYLAMFRDEGRLAARLMHANVVQTYEVGFENGRHFIAMEYLDGQSYARVANKMGAGLPLDMRVKVLAEICAGLEYAHDLTDYDGSPLSVVHRDISPQNIFITYDGLVKLLDFGVAKALGAQHQTESGVIKGRLRYMAPEQARNDVDARADIYSVGVLLWEAVTETRMWSGIADLNIMQRLLTGDLPKIIDHKPDAPPELVAICEKALATDPKDRYQSVIELQAALSNYLADSSSTLTTRAIGKLVATTFAEERARIRQAIDQKVKQLRARESVAVLPLLPTSDPALPTVDVTDEPKTESRMHQAADIANRKKGSAGTIATVAAIVVLVGGGAMYLAMRSHPTVASSDPTPPPTTSTLPSPEGAPPDAATAAVSSEPIVDAASSTTASAEKPKPHVPFIGRPTTTPPTTTTKPTATTATPAATTPVTTEPTSTRPKKPKRDIDTDFTPQ